MAVDRIRQQAGWHPAVALELVGTLVVARDHAVAAGRKELAVVLDDQADLEAAYVATMWEPGG